MHQVIEAKRKIEDAKKLKEIKAKSQIDFESFLNQLEPDMVKKVKHRILKQEICFGIQKVMYLRIFLYFLYGHSDVYREHME